MALAGFAEQDGLNAATGTERFFNEADAFNADTTRFGLQTAPQGYAKLFQPAIVPAGNRSTARIRRSRIPAGFDRRSHTRSVPNSSPYSLTLGPPAGCFALAAVAACDTDGGRIPT